MSNVPERSNWTGPASSGSVSESAGGNSEMLTFVPVDAKGGITLHPGPGPFGPGPGPFAARTIRPSSRSRVSLSAEEPAPETAVIAVAAANTTIELTHFDRLVIFALLLFV